MNSIVKRIALIGPESTGKSSLCKSLAEHFNTLFVPEFSRTYVQELKRKYTVEDVLYCINSQYKEEEKLLNHANRFLFADTESIMGKVWLEDVFQQCPSWVDELISNHPYDLYLLTYPDLPFQSDPVRENPERREFFFDWYERELRKRNLNYTIIKGFHNERIQLAISSVEKIVQRAT